MAFSARSVDRPHVGHHVVFPLELLATDRALVVAPVRVDGDVVPVEVGRVRERLETL